MLSDVVDCFVTIYITQIKVRNGIVSVLSNRAFSFFDRQPGVYFAKILQQMWTNVTPTAAYWTPTKIVEDTRIPAGEVSPSAYAFEAPEGAVEIRAELVFRRGYYELMEQKGWNTPDFLMTAVDIQIP